MGNLMTPVVTVTSCWNRLENFAPGKVDETKINKNNKVGPYHLFCRAQNSTYFGVKQAQLPMYPKQFIGFFSPFS